MISKYDSTSGFYEFLDKLILKSLEQYIFRKEKAFILLSMASSTIFSSLEIQSHVETNVEKDVHCDNATSTDQNKQADGMREYPMESSFNQEISIQSITTTKTIQTNIQDKTKDMDVVMEDYNQDELINISVVDQENTLASIQNNLENHSTGNEHGNHDSFIDLNPQQNHSQSQSKQSFKNYSKFILTLYKKAILSMVPFLILILVVYLPIQFLNVNNKVGLSYTTVTSVCGGVFYFIATWVVSFVVFDSIPVHKSIMRIGVPWLICDTFFSCFEVRLDTI